MANVGRLTVMVGANIGGLQSGLTRASRSVTSFGSGVASGLGRAATSAVGLGVVGTTAAAAVAGITAVGKGVKLAAEFEQSEVALTTMLGSADTAQTVLSDLTTFAAKTPFEFPELVDATKQLAAFGVSSNDLIPTLTRIGDVASGISQPIGEIATIYGKAKVQGRLFAEDINQLTGRGIPVIQELATQFGVTETEVRKLVESGQVNFGHLEQAFKSLTTGSGTFAGLMKEQSGTLLGLWSTLKDNINLSLRDIGKGITESLNLKGSIQSSISFTDTFRGKVVPVITDGLKMLKFHMKNWSDMVGLVALQAGLSFLSFALDVKHLFTNTIPEALKYVRKNWREIFTTIGNFTSTVFSNLLTNAANFGKAIWEAIKGGDWSFAWTPLTEGFESALSEAPEFTKRAVTGIEQTLKEQVDGLKTSLANDWMELFPDPTKAPGPGTGAGAAANETIAPVAGSFGLFAAAAGAAAVAAAKTATGISSVETELDKLLSEGPIGSVADAIDRTDARTGAAAFGTAEAFAATAAQRQTELGQMVMYQSETLDQIRKQLDEMQRIRRRLEDENSQLFRIGSIA